MTTRDRLATSSITYKTLGWTIKRYDAPIDAAENECAYIALTSLFQFPDPEDSAYCYTTFFCDKDTIFNAIGSVSADWQDTLYQNGGIVYLDAIMTVCHNGVPLGALTEPPLYTGQVYFRYQDIATAEHWARPESLISHFDKSLTFPANPALLGKTSYTVAYAELTEDNSALSLSRYGQDTSGILKDWTSCTFSHSDFSAHYFYFDHTSVHLDYYPGYIGDSDLVYTEDSPIVLSNALGQIASISVTHYYRRKNPDEYLQHRYLMSEDGQLNTEALAFVSASERNLETNHENYDVTMGIPSGSYVNLSSRVSPFAYEARFHHYYGEITCSVPVSTSYRLCWSDSSGFHEEWAVSNEWYYVDRKFSFYCLSDYTVYVLQSVLFVQNALEKTLQSVSNPTPVNCTIETDADPFHHLIFPTSAPLALDGGVLMGDGSRPLLPSHAMQAQAEAAIGTIQVQNDQMQIGSFLLLDNTPAETEAASPVQPFDNPLTELAVSDCLIPETKPNSSQYETLCAARYKSISSDAVLARQFEGNSIVVHTPVYCDTQISDGKKWNQQLQPLENRASLILGHDFTLRTACKGSHVDLPGYGERDYSSYVRDIQVSFPFPVYLGETLLSENLWHTVPAEAQFYLPTGVPEGLYSIKVRVFAKNTPDTRDEERLTSLCEKDANLSRTHTIATRTIRICVTGRLFQFSFSADGGSYTVGSRDKDGKETGIPLKNCFPVPDCPFFTALPFTLTTIGTPPFDGDYLELVPSFYHVDNTGNNRQPVDLYLITEEHTLKKYSDVLRLSSQTAAASGSADRNVSDADTAIQSVQTWSGDFLLPEPLIVVPSGTHLTDTLEEKGSLSLKDSCFLQDGFLLINFSITYHRSALPSLSYINRSNAEKGFCNMWKTEGFLYERTDISHNTWQFSDGDSLLFSLKKKRKIYTAH